MQKTCASYVARKEIYFKLTNGAYPNESIEQFIDRLVKELEALPPVTPQPKIGQWVPVSERLPHKGEYGKVLVTYIPSGGTLWTTVIIAHYSDLMGIAKPSFHIGEVGKGSFQNITNQVIAWMPLPSPYKGE